MKNRLFLSMVKWSASGSHALLDHFAGVVPHRIAHGGAAQHARHLFDALLPGQGLDRSECPPSRGALAHTIMRLRQRRDLGKVRDAQDLVTRRELAKLAADHLGDATSDS